jgi:hypothetical protein
VINAVEEDDSLLKCLGNIANLRYHNFKVILLDYTAESSVDFGTDSFYNSHNFKYILAQDKNPEYFISKSKSQINTLITTNTLIEPNFLHDTVPYLRYYNKVLPNIENSDFSNDFEENIYGCIFDKDIIPKPQANLLKHIFESIFNLGHRQKILHKKIPVRLGSESTDDNILNHLSKIQRKHTYIGKFGLVLIVLIIIAYFLIVFRSSDVNILFFATPYILLNILLWKSKNPNNLLKKLLINGSEFYYFWYSKITKDIVNYVYFINCTNFILTILFYTLVSGGFIGLNLPSVFLIIFYGFSLATCVFVNQNVMDLNNKIDFREFDQKIRNWKKQHNLRKVISKNYSKNRIGRIQKT